MKTRTILIPGLISSAAVIVALIAIDAAVAFYSSSRALASPLALAGVDQVRIGGSASQIAISTRADQAPEARLGGRRDGWGALWHSGWFFSDACAPDAGMRLDGATLVVEVGDGGRLFDWSDCTVELSVNLPSGATVTIDQQAARIGLAGEFAQVSINSDAGDVSFTGHAIGLAINGAALRARLAYERVAQDETILLTGQMMDVGLKFLTPTPISYLVEASASLVDSVLPNTPGARPAITIRGELARVRIE